MEYSGPLLFGDRAPIPCLHLRGAGTGKKHGGGGEGEQLYT